MRAFCGWLGLGQPDDGASASVLRDMMGGERTPGQLTVAQGRGWLLALAPGPGEASIVEHGGVHLLLTGHPRTGAATGSDAIAAELRPAMTPGASMEGLTGLRGQFGLVALCPESGVALLMVDRFATHPVYSALVPGGVVFGSSPRIVAGHPRVGRELRAQALYDFVYANVIPAPLTVYSRVDALQAGRCMRTAKGSVEHLRYWQPRFRDDGPSLVGTGAERETLDLLKNAVGRAADGAAVSGCFLSGGMDSSTVVGCVRALSDAAPRTYSIGFEAEGYDEMSYARLVARHFDAEHREYYVTPDDIVELVPRVARAFGQPFGNSSVVPAYYCAVLAKDSGVGHLLAGDGGDELFGGNVRYGRNWVYSLHGRLPGAARSALEHWAAAPEPVLGRLPGLRKGVSYVRQASVPMPARMETYNYVNRLGANRVFSPAFLDTVDPERVDQARLATYEGAETLSELNRMLALDFEITLADNDLQKVSVMCREAGVTVGYPFLDEDVVDFSLALTPKDKVNRTHLRWFFRKAVTGFLPDAVIAKSKHGFGLPFGLWAVQHAGLAEWVNDAMLGARRRGVINPTLVDELQETLLHENPVYYGPLVWTIATLETWMQENVGSP